MAALKAREQRFSARDGLRLGALEWAGDATATPLLCLPGLSRTALDFGGVAARQAGRRRVVALDHAGHGLSDRAADPARYRVELALRDVLDAMAALHLHRVVVLGTSFGGILGMALSVLRPTGLAGLVLNDVGPRIEPAGTGFVRDFIGRDPGFSTAEQATEFLRGALPPLGLDDVGWRRMTDLTYARGEDGLLHPRWDTRLAERVTEGAAPADLWGLFDGLAGVPLLLVWGQESNILSATTVQRMRQARPDMAVASLPGIGHSPTLEEPAAIAALDRFLAAVP